MPTVSKLGKELIKDINVTITELRSSGLLRDEMGVSQQIINGDILEISYCGKNDTSRIVFDKHITCSKLMDTLLAGRQYNILFYDKSLLQAEFFVSTNAVLKERLVFIKKHNRIWSIDEIDQYDALDEDWFSEEPGIPIMIRIDYDPDNHKECDHAVAHLTLSNHESCRIPLKNAVTFSEFVRFVLLHFYDIKLNVPNYRFSGADSITDLEKKMIHMSWN